VSLIAHITVTSSDGGEFRVLEFDLVTVDLAAFKYILDIVGVMVGVELDEALT